MTTINRKILFYRIKMGKTENNQMRFLSNPAEIGNIVIKGFNYIKGLPFDRNQKNNNYLKIDSTKNVSVKVDSIYTSENYIEGRIIYCRRNDLPSIEEKGILKLLNIPADASVAEITHFVYFYKTNVIGIEFNMFGPKSNDLSKYLQAKLATYIDMVTIKVIVTPKWGKLLSQNNYRLTMLSFGASRDSVSVAKDLNTGFGKMFSAAAEATVDADEIEVVLKRKPYSGNTFSSENFHWDSFFENILTESADYNQINKLQVGVQVGTKAEIINLLEERLAVNKTVPVMLERKKSVVTTKMYSAIEEAYLEYAKYLE